MSILALDISTAVTGFCILDMDAKIKDYGWIVNGKSKDDHFKKMDICIHGLLSKIKYKYKINDIVAEEPLQKLSGGGQSTAKTITKLARFNFCLLYNLRQEFQVPTNVIPATTARAKCGIKIPKGYKDDDKKEYIRQQVAQMYPKIEWPLNKKGNVDKKNFDVADAVVIGKAWTIIRKD